MNPGSFAVADAHARLGYESWIDLADEFGNQVVHRAPPSFEMRGQVIAVLVKRGSFVDAAAALLGVQAVGAAPVVVDDPYLVDRLAEYGASVYDLSAERFVVLGRELRGGERIAACVLTSGSTGEPRLVGVPRDEFRSGVRKKAGTPRLVRSFVALGTNGFLRAVMDAKRLGAQYKFGGLTLQDFEGISAGAYPELHLAPLHAEEFARYGTATNGSVHRIAISSSLPRTGLIDDLARKFPNAQIYNNYGLTEAGTARFSHEVHSGDPAGLVGEGVRGAQLRLEPIPELPGHGAVFVRSVARRYELVDGGWVPIGDRDGWIQTGDVAWARDDGKLELRGRITDYIAVGGNRVSPTAAERELSGVEGADEVAVVAAPDPRLGEVPCAVISGIQTTSDVQLRTMLKDRIPQIEIPRSFVYLDTPLPRTHNGKIDRRAIRHLLERVR
jgi:hypothetical protein